MSNWQPTPNELLTLVSLFRNATSGDMQMQQSTLQQLDQVSLIPEYINYLCYIFNSQETEDDIRSIAGLSLKNSLPLKWNSLDPLILAYAKQSILKGLSDPSELVKKVAGSIITTIVTKGLIDQWPEVLQKLLELIQYPETAIGAFGALEKICEDSAERLDQQSPEFVQLMIQQMLLHLQNPNADIRASVVKCINQFLLIRSDSIWKHLDGFMQMLYKLTLDPSQKVRRYVCQSFNHIVELGAEVLIPVLDAVVDFMLLNTQDEDKELALEAADFWLVFCEQETMHIHLQRFLGKILPVLLKCMIYSEDDLFILEQNADNAHVEDRQQDIAPRFHKGKTHELEGETTIPGDDESENDYEDYEDYDDEWNVRKSTAAALDTLSSVFGDDLLSDLLPTINQMLSHPDWKTKEASILAIGAVAQGCAQGMEPHLPGLIPHLVGMLTHEKPLIRSITSWTIGRYASWICIPNPENLAIHYQQYLVPILQGILMLCADNNKEVQKSGCSALATIEEEARENLVPYLEPIIDTLTKCFHIYQKKNLLILYDTFGTLAEAVGSNLSQKQYIDKFMPPLLQKYQECEDDDYDLFSILESLASIATALGVSFAPYCLPIWQRCVRLIKQTLSDADAYNRDPNNHVQPDKDFIVISLDLLGAIVQALGAESEGLLLDPTEPTLFVLLKMTMNDETADARSCSFALLGDIAINSFKSLIPHLNDFVGLAAQNIRTGCDSTQTASMNNACWALGEISLRNQNQMSQYTPVLLQRLVPLLLSRDTPRSLSENSSITIGRLALNNPELIAPHLQTFLTRFMESLVAVNDNMEKREALFGILKAIKLNPAPLLESFEGFVNVGTSKSESAELKREFFELLSAIKAQMKVEDWDLLKVRLPEFLKEGLRIFYGL